MASLKRLIIQFKIDQAWKILVIYVLLSVLLGKEKETNGEKQNVSKKFWKNYFGLQTIFLRLF